MQHHWLKQQCILVSREFTLFQKKKKQTGVGSTKYQLQSQNSGINEDPSLPGCWTKQSSTLKMWAVWSFESVVFIIRQGTTSHNTLNLSNTAMWTSDLTAGSMSRQHSEVHTVNQTLTQWNKHSVLWITAPPLTLLPHKLKYSHHPTSTRRFRSA
jgi:hypothetical protein